MKVTFVPEQIVFPGFAVIFTLAVTFGFTVIAIAFDVAGFPETQVAFEVISQVTTSPFANVKLEYVSLFVPTFVEPILH